MELLMNTAVSGDFLPQNFFRRNYTVKLNSEGDLETTCGKIEFYLARYFLDFYQTTHRKLLQIN